MADDVPSLLRRGKELREQGKYDEALVIYDEVLAAGRRAPHAMLDRAFCLAKLGRGREALESCDDAYRVDMRDARIPRRAAGILAEAGMSEDAAVWYEKAQSLDPRDPELLCEMGKFYAGTGDPTKATECYDKAYDLGPDDILLREIAGFYSRTGDRKKAAECIQRMKIDLGNHSMLYDAATYLLEAGNPKEAAAYSNMALDAIPDDRKTADLHKDIHEKYKQCCRNYEEPGVLLLLIPDTNWWLGFYSIKGGGPVKDELVGTGKGDIQNRIRNGSLKITYKVHSEFKGVVKGRIDDARKDGDETMACRLERSLNSFLGFYNDNGNVDAETCYQHMYDRANRMYREIWRDCSPAAKTAKKEWAKGKREEYDPTNPPQKGGDQRILAEAGTLARLYKERRTVIVTADNDFKPFSGWIWRRFGVCIKRSDRR